MKPIPRIFVIALVVLAAFWAVPVPAQTETTGGADAKEAAPAEPAGPQPILAADVNGRADDAVASLKAMRTSIDDVAVLETIEQELPPVIEELETQRAALAEDTLATDYSIAALDDVRSRWVRIKGQLDQWYSTLDGRSQSLQQSRAELKTLEELWKVTRDSAAEQEFPDALNERVASVIAEIGDVRTLYDARIDRVLTLESKISGHRADLGDVVTTIDGALEVVRRRLLTIDSPPLWKALFDPESRESLSGQAQSSYRQLTSAMVDFRRSYRSRIHGHLVVFAFVTVLLVIMVQRAKRLPADADEDRALALRIISTPIAGALLLNLFPVFWLYPQAPTVIYQFNLLLLMLPTLRILPRVIPRELHLPLYAMSATYVLLKAYELSMDDTLLERLVLLLVSGLGAGGLFWLVRPAGRAAKLEGDWLWRASIVGARIATGALALAFLANVVGNVGLASVFTTSTMTAIYAGVLIFSFTLALRSVLAVALSLPLMGNLRTVANNREVIKRRGRRFFRAAGVLFWIWVCFGIMNIRAEMLAAMTAVLTYRFGTETFTISLGDVAVFFLSLWAAAQISKFIRWVLGEDIFPRVQLPRGVSSSMSMVVHYGIMAVGFLFAIAAAGIELDKIAIVIGALGVGIGFGLQSLVNNFVSGLILIFERPINVGDTVQMAGGLVGEVRRIGIRASVVRTFEGAEVIVPNGNLVSAEVTNWTLSDRLRRIEVPVGVAYGTDPEQVLEILIAAAREDKEVLDFPEPYGLFIGFGESSLDFVLRFWTSNFDWWRIVASRVTIGVSKGLKEAEITIPFPQRDLHVKSVTQSARAAMADDASPEPAEGGS